MNFLLATVPVLTIFVSSCATPYQPLGSTGGYSEVKAGQNRYIVSFQGNGFTSQGIVEQYAYRRAQELCESMGYDRAEVVGDQDSSSSYRTPDNYNCSASATSYGNTTNVKSNCYNSGGIQFTFHLKRIMASCEGGSQDKSDQLSIASEKCSSGESDSCAFVSNTLFKQGNFSEAAQVSSKACKSGSQFGCVVLTSVGMELVNRGKVESGRNFQEVACRGGHGLACTILGSSLVAGGEKAKGKELLETGCSLDEPSACKQLSAIEGDKSRKRNYLDKAKILFGSQCKDKHVQTSCDALVEINLAH